jgi:hypothetical protein
MEGQSLHPQVSPNGVRLFDDEEVDRIATKVIETGRALPRGTFVSSAAEDFTNVDETDDTQEQLDAALRENHVLEAQLDEARVQSDAAQNDLLSLKSNVRRWAKDIDQACALMLKAETDEIQQLTVDAVIETLEAMQRKTE